MQRSLHLQLAIFALCAGLFAFACWHQVQAAAFFFNSRPRANPQITNTLAAYYTFESNAVSLTGINHWGTNKPFGNDLEFTDALVNNGLNLSADNGSWLSQTNVGMLQGPNYMVLGFWVYIDPDTIGAAEIAQQGGADPDWRFYFTPAGDGSNAAVYFYRAQATTKNNFLVEVNAAGWFQFIMAGHAVSNSFYIWVNGSYVLKNTGTSHGVFSATTASIGNNAAGTAGVSTIRVDEMFIYTNQPPNTYWFTDAHAQWLYNSGAGRTFDGTNWN